MRFYCAETLSGILSVNFYLLTETSNWPTTLSDRSSSQIIFAAEENTVEATVDADSFRDKSKPKSTTAGDLYEINLEYGFLTRSEALEQLLDQYANQPGVAVVKFYNGFSKLYGSNNEPLFLKFLIDNGTTIESNASTDIQLAGEMRSRPVYYTP